MAAWEMLYVMVQCSQLPWQGTKAERLSTVAVAHWAPGTELEALKLIPGALAVP